MRPHNTVKYHRKQLLRSNKRLAIRDRNDQSIISEYLPLSVSFLFDFVIPGPLDDFVPPPWLLENVTSVFHQDAPVPSAPPVQFNTDTQSLTVTRNMQSY